MPVAVDQEGFDRTAAHGGNGVETLAFAENEIACVQWADMFDQHVQIVQGGLVQAFVHARLRERAGGAKAEIVTVIGLDAGGDARKDGSYRRGRRTHGDGLERFNGHGQCGTDRLKISFKMQSQKWNENNGQSSAR